jgi:hypothetical protein
LTIASSEYFAKKKRMKLEPINPAPPVTKTLNVTFLLSILALSY